MALPQEIIDRVRESSDIVAVVGEHVQLKRTGRAWKALCPFHKEKTPSFTVNSDRQIFKCFGCGMGGDVFRFLMEFEKLSFPETVELLAGRSGIALPRQRWEGPAEESVYPALEWAASEYQKAFHGPAGVPARRYMEGRGLGEACLRRFGVGWAPEAWSTILDAAGRKFSPELLHRAGLVVEREHGGYYDRLRGRVVFPIRSALGKTIGFGGRLIGEGEPKYLNGPETEVFHKGRVLFGLSEARESLKETGEVLVAEGYLDVLSLVQAGFTGTVATCGTAFTADQARVLKRYVERAVLVYDGDEAGIRAAWKSAATFLGEGLEVRIAVFPGNHDPDSFVQEEGPEALAGLLGAAPGVVGFARTVLLDRVDKRENLIKAFAYLGARIDDSIRRRVLVQEAAEAFRFDESVLAGEVLRLRREDRRAAGTETRRAVPGRRDVVGRTYLAHLIAGREVGEGGLVEPTAFREDAVRDLYALWLELRGEADPDPKGRLLAREEARDLTAEILAEDTGEETGFEAVAARLRERVRGDRGRGLEEAIREAETRGDDAQVERLNRELQELRRPHWETPPGADDHHTVRREGT